MFKFSRLELILSRYLPGKWFIFWHSCNSLNISAFICFPQVPPHSEQVFRISLKPELVTTFLTTAGVMLDSFHLKSFLSSAGKDDTDTSLWWTKFMVGGTLENKDRLRGGADI